MYAPTLRKWCLMNILMYLWLAVLGLILIGWQGTSAMHHTTSAIAPSNSYGDLWVARFINRNRSHEIRTTAKDNYERRTPYRRRSSSSMVETLWPAIVPIRSSNSNGDEIKSRFFYRTLFSRHPEHNNNPLQHYDNNLLISSHPSQKKGSQLSVMFKLWERRRQIEALRKRLFVPPSVQIQDTRQNESDLPRFGGDLRSDSEQIVLSSARDNENDLDRGVPRLIPARTKRDSRVPKYQQNLPQLQSPGQSSFHPTRQLFHQTASNLNPSALFPHQQQQQQFRDPLALKGSHPHNPNASKNGPKSRKYCSARDATNLAYVAPVVFEGKVKSMNTDNYSVTFQVMRVRKRQPGFLQLPTHMRIHFKQVKSMECDLHREKYRNPGHVRGKLEQGKTYFIFGKFVEMNNFTLIGQPMRNTLKNDKEVTIGLGDSYGQNATIERLLLKNGRDNRLKKIVCKVNGRPPPNVTWFKNGQMISRPRHKYKFVHRKRQSQLIIKSFNSSDYGVYECRASNKATKIPVSKTISVGPNPSTMPSTTTARSLSSEEDKQLLGAEECNEEQGYKWCLNGGKCIFFRSVQEYSCRCVDGFAGSRCQTKTPTLYNQSSTEFGFLHMAVVDDGLDDDFDDYEQH